MGNRKKRLLTWLPLSLLFVTGAATGCSPAVQPPQAQQTLSSGATPPPINVPGSSADWGVIKRGVTISGESGLYMEKILVDVSQGTLHSDLSVYGAVNGATNTSLAFHENSRNMKYYQQNQSAYEQDNSQWSQVAPLRNVDVWPSYQALVDASSSGGIRLEMLHMAPRFVVDEYCDVYQAVIPPHFVPVVSQFGNAGAANSSGVVYTFFVGQHDHAVREVSTQSVGAVENVGGVQITTDAVFFAIASNNALMQIPFDLYTSLLQN